MVLVFLLLNHITVGTIVWFKVEELRKYESVREYIVYFTARCTLPSDTTHSSNVESMLVHRLRRWPNFDPTLFKCSVCCVTCLLL